MADIEELARLTIDCGLKIHRDMGPGLLESIFAEGFRTDLLVDDGLIAVIDLRE